MKNLRDESMKNLKDDRKVDGADKTSPVQDTIERKPLSFDTSIEWLEADGLGGFASGTSALVRTRRYHALLLAASHPPAGRIVLVNGLEAWVETPAGRYALSTQQYGPDIQSPDGVNRISFFSAHPWPRWEFRLDDGTLIEFELFVPLGRQAVAMRWRQLGMSRAATLNVRLLLSGRDSHAMHHENPQFNFEPQQLDGQVVWRPYPGIPGVAASHDGRYFQNPVWYRNFFYNQEEALGLDCREDLASPGMLQWELNEAPAVLLLEAIDTAISRESRDRDEGIKIAHQAATANLLSRFDRWRRRERRRREAFPSRLEQAADAYVVQGSHGRTVVAGYPWFTDWGRDTFIAVRGLCLTTGRLDQARDVLLGWAAVVSQGMLPNRFPDQEEMPDYSSVDASLWYIVAVHDYLQARRNSEEKPGFDMKAMLEKGMLEHAVNQILEGYAAGTRFGIRLDTDGLLAAGEPGVPLTWMNAKIGDWVVTPRIGKPVEVQALWLNALWIAGNWTDRWYETLERGRKNFSQRFISMSGQLHDVVDVNHVRGTVDSTLRPNQILAVGGLPLPLLEGEAARRVVDIVEQQLWTPLGLRTLTPNHPDYSPRYVGNSWERNRAYHQGTVWPWLAGPFVEAWVRVHGATAEAKRQARQRFSPPFFAHLDHAGSGHVSEIADGEAPHTPRGCPFQASSLGEVLRLNNGVLAEPGQGKRSVAEHNVRALTSKSVRRLQSGAGG